MSNVMGNKSERLNLTFWRIHCKLGLGVNRASYIKSMQPFPGVEGLQKSLVLAVVFPLLPICISWKVTIFVMRQLFHFDHAMIYIDTN